MFLSQSERRRLRLVDWPAATLLASRGLRRIRQARRLARWKASPRSFDAPPIDDDGERTFIHFEKRIPLRRCDGDPRLENGKATNVALAAIALDGRVLAPGRIFSFWRTVGQPTRTRGFAFGKEVRAGCVLPTIGGGLCLLSNALFEAASTLGWKIHERFGHTISVSDNPSALDATVAWPDVDLRFEPRNVVVIRCQTDSEQLSIRIESDSEPAELWTVEAVVRPPDTPDVIVRDLFRRHRDAAPERIGSDRLRVRRDLDEQANCFTCDEGACLARPRNLALASIQYEPPSRP